MRRVKASGIKLPFLSEPAELRFDHSLISAERWQVEEVKTLSRLSCRRQNNKKYLEKWWYTGKAQALKQRHSRARLRLYAHNFLFLCALDANSLEDILAEQPLLLLLTFIAETPHRVSFQNVRLAFRGPIRDRNHVKKIQHELRSLLLRSHRWSGDILKIEETIQLLPGHFRRVQTVLRDRQRGDAS